jgi:hypothetical protein
MIRYSYCIIFFQEFCSEAEKVVTPRIWQNNCGSMGSGGGSGSGSGSGSGGGLGTGAGTGAGTGGGSGATK